MTKSPRAVLLAAFGVGPLLLIASCGGSTPTGARATIANIQPTSFVEVAPATTTTTTTLPPDFSPEAGTRSPAEQTYIVAAGDSLARIAELHDITLEQLVNYNQFPDGANQLILPGDEIKIPPNSLVPGTATASNSGGGSDDTATDSGDDDTATGGGCTHIIAAGEFPGRVATSYGITYEELQAANPAMDMSVTFVVGAEIIIPPNGDCS